MSSEVAADQVRVLYSFAHPYGSQGIGTTARAQVEGLRSLGVQVDVWCTSIAPGTPAAGCRTTMTAFGRRIPLRTIGLSRAWRFHDHRVATELRRNPGHYSLVHGWPLASAAVGMGVGAWRRERHLACSLPSRRWRLSIGTTIRDTPTKTCAASRRI